MGILDLHKLAGQIVDAAREIGSRVKEVDAEIAELTRQRSALEAIPLTKEDYLAQVRKHIRLAGEVHKALLDKEFDAVNKSVHAANLNELPVNIFNCGLPRGGAVTEIAMCYFFEDQLVDGVGRAIDELGWSSGSDAMSLADIEDRIAGIHNKTEALLTERADLVAALKCYQLSE